MQYLQYLLMSVHMSVLSADIIDLSDHALVMLPDFSPEAAGKCGYEPKREIEYCIGADKAQKLFFSISKT